jgi:hypothetical protein
MVFRMADTVESMVALNEGKYALDTLILLRALYEQVVTFRWLAISPEKHIDAWGVAEFRWQLRLHKDSLAYGHLALSPAGVAAAERGIEQAAGKGANMPPLKKLAEEVDEHWGGRMIGFREPGASELADLLNFGGLYLGIYRIGSKAAHIEPESLNAYLDRQSYPVVVDEPVVEDDEAIWWSLAVPLYAQALIVCNSVLKWPDLDAVLAVNNRMYGLD